MSRRRKPLSADGGAARVLIECTHSRDTSHAPYRIAQCTVWLDRFTPAALRVEYVHARDAEHAKRDRVRARGIRPDVDVYDTHITYPLTCGECGRHLPIEKEKLATLVAHLARMSVPRVELADITP